MYTLQSCGSSDSQQQGQGETAEAEVINLEIVNAEINQMFPANLQGKDNIQLRPQISGYIDKIYVDEGAYVKAGLPEPEIKEFQNGLLVTLFKNNLTTEQLTKLGLNARQLKAVEYVKEKGKITNKEYQELNSVAKPTATRDLAELVEKFGILNNIGKGAGSYYEIIGSQKAQVWLIIINKTVKNAPYTDL